MKDLFHCISRQATTEILQAAAQSVRAYNHVNRCSSHHFFFVKLQIIRHMQDMRISGLVIDIVFLHFICNPISAETFSRTKQALCYSQSALVYLKCSVVWLFPTDILHLCDTNEPVDHVLRCHDIKTNPWGILPPSIPKLSKLLNM